MMIDENQTACACLRVTDVPEHLDGGLMRSRWVCQDCGREFIPKPHFYTDNLKVKALMAAVHRYLHMDDPDTLVLLAALRDLEVRDNRTVREIQRDV